MAFTVNISIALANTFGHFMIARENSIVSAIPADGRRNRNNSKNACEEGVRVGREEGNVVALPDFFCDFCCCGILNCFVLFCSVR